MIDRKLKKLLLERLKVYPAVAIVGARQCGKTTLAKSIKGIYFDLEQESQRLSLDLQWDDIITDRKLIILDEAQSWPDIFPRLRGAIDSVKRKGKFLLLGSVSPSLMRHISESLAGRLSLVELTPLLLSELKTQASRKRRWLCGGYPDGGVLEPKRYPQWQIDYLTLLTQRDLPNWGLPAKPQMTMRLLRMLAALHGQIWNASQVGQSLGLSYNTVNSYLDYLEGAFLIRRLQPYRSNIKKRLIKSPKVYWQDSGLLHSLLNIPDENSLLTQPWVGASWEGFIIEQILGELAASGKNVDAYYLRTSDQYELDLVLDFGNELWAIKIKLTASPTPNDMNRLKKTSDMISASRCFLISRTRSSVGDRYEVSCNIETFIEQIHSNL